MKSLADLKNQADVKNLADLENQANMKSLADLKNQADMKSLADLKNQADMKSLADLKNQADMKSLADLKNQCKLSKKKIKRGKNERKIKDIKAQNQRLKKWNETKNCQLNWRLFTSHFWVSCDHLSCVFSPSGSGNAVC
jgi:hypothetical protein